MENLQAENIIWRWIDSQFYPVTILPPGPESPELGWNPWGVTGAFRLNGKPGVYDRFFNSRYRNE